MTPIQKQQQDERPPLLLAPGPTEVDPAVLKAMTYGAESHFSQPFCNTFGDVLSMLRKLFQSEDPSAQPFVISGSGTLGWDFVATNILEPGDSVLCLSTGFFADAFESCLTTYGAQTNKLKAPIGAAVSLEEVEEALKAHHYKAVVATHVETSTGVLTQLKPIAELIKRISPETLFIVDGVASVACEDIQFDAWNIDVVLTGSQKALSCPPGLSIIMVSKRAINVAQCRQAPQVTWYASLARWLPIMQNYEAKRSSYFATPPTQLVHALHKSLTSILSRPIEEQFRQHIAKSNQVKKVVESVGLSQLAANPDHRANGLTAFWLPEGLSSKALLSAMLSKGIMLAAGMHPDFGSRYVRFGHMGYSATHDSGSQVDQGLEAFKEVISEFWLSQRSKKKIAVQNEIALVHPQVIRSTL